MGILTKMENLAKIRQSLRNKLNKTIKGNLCGFDENSEFGESFENGESLQKLKWDGKVALWDWQFWRKCRYLRV